MKGVRGWMNCTSAFRPLEEEVMTTHCLNNPAMQRRLAFSQLMPKVRGPLKRQAILLSACAV